MTAWTDFVGERMSKYMKKYGSHAKAMAQISKEWKKEKAKNGKKKTTKPKTQKKLLGHKGHQGKKGAHKGHAKKGK